VTGDQRREPLISPFTNLTESAIAVLRAADPAEKVRLSHAVAKAWHSGTVTDIGQASPPDRPARPMRPELLRPGDMPRRRIGKSAKGRVALLHAIAHIELNAIDLAWDLVARAAAEDLPRAFFDDWVRVADEEAKHFALVAERLAALDAAYGDLPAHDGLWEAAEATAGDLLARLAVVPLVLEARGLDVTPAMIDKLAAAGDRDSVAVLKTIYLEEISHVAAGRRWFDFLAARRGLDPQSAWQTLVKRHFKGQLKPPFNDEGRGAAGLPREYYAPLAG